MSTDYDFYKNPIPQGSNRRPRLHARVVPKATVDTEQLARYIHDASSLTTGDVKATLTMLSEMIVRELKSGNRVHIDGLGYFEMTLQCPPVKDPKEIRAESIRFKSVAFRPDASLKGKLSTTRFQRVAHKSHSKEASDTEIDERLTTYFATHDYITRSDFQHLCGLTKSTASRRLQECLQAGKLRKEGLYKFPLYVPTEGHYGK